MNKVLLDENKRIVELNDIFGENRLKVFDKIGLGSKYTDFAYALEEHSKRERNLPRYQIKVSEDSTFRLCVEDNMLMSYVESYYIGKGVRLVTSIPYEKENEIFYDDNKVPYVYHDEYPQTVATKWQDHMIDELGLETGDTYSISSLRAFLKRIEKPEDFLVYAKEYELDDEKFVRIRLENMDNAVFSTGREVKQLQNVSFKVEPIKWYVDEETGLLVSDRILSASIPYDYLANHKSNVKRLVKENKKN